MKKCIYSSFSVETERDNLTMSEESWGGGMGGLRVVSYTTAIISFLCLESF